MIKEKIYLDIDELIKNIKSKGIIIENIDDARKILKNNNYYVLMGYKTLFCDYLHIYKKEVDFKNIYNLYLFDRKLKLLLLNSLLDIENIVKNSIINVFCKKYGFKEENYLNKENFNQNHKYLNKTFKVFIKQIQEKSSENIAVLYYKQYYGFVPFWVISKILSFGLIKEIYSIMKDDDKKQVMNEVSNFDDMKIKSMFTSLQLLVDIRNKIAHDEIVYNHRHRKIILSRTNEHRKFKNLHNNNGLNDIFGVLICIKNYLPKSAFNILIEKLDILIDEYINENEIITKKDLLFAMNLPTNYKILKW